MKERPILMKGVMVRATLEDRKTQTRRIIKPQPSPCGLRQLTPGDIAATGLDASAWYGADPFTEAFKCPYGVPGDRLWVKETWMPFDVAGFDYELPKVTIGYKATNDVRPEGVSHESFGASKEFECQPEDWRKFCRDIECMEACGDRWRPSIFMPRWASRITLEIEAVRVERLIEITAENCIAEGIVNRESWTMDGPSGLPWMQPEGAYRELWESINGPGSWDLNPWCWVIQFRRVK